MRATRSSTRLCIGQQPFSQKCLIPNNSHPFHSSLISWEHDLWPPRATDRPVGGWAQKTIGTNRETGQPTFLWDSHVIDVSPRCLLQHLVCHLKACRKLGVLWRGRPRSTVAHGGSARTASNFEGRVRGYGSLQPVEPPSALGTARGGAASDQTRGWRTGSPARAERLPGAKGKARSTSIVPGKCLKVH